MFTNKVLSLIAAGCLLTSVALAGTLELNPDHPETYTVQEGDTLWDLSTKFLSEPWRWREIWQSNPQIENPDLIYPGDVLTLIFTGGEPSLVVSRAGGRPTVKLSPSVREIPLDQIAVPTIPIDAIQQFLLRPRVVGENELEQSPYVVSLGSEHLVGGSGSKIYVRGIGRDLRNRYIVYRQGNPYVDPESGEVLGYEAIHIADAVLERIGDPTTMIISRSTREVLKGDRLLSVTEDKISSHFYPKSPDTAVDGQIISVVEGVTQIGQGQVVVLNVGTSDGIAIGDVMAVYQTGELVQGVLAGLAHPQLAKVIMAIHQAPAEAWTLEKMLELAHMSRSKFAEEFRRTLGQSPGDYVIEWRVTVAQNLLKKNKPVGWIANEVGYENSSALARVFRKKTGLSPKEWQKNNEAPHPS